MSCRKKRRYFVISADRTLMLGYKKTGEFGWILNLPWLRPYLFTDIAEARKLAEPNRSSVRYWQGNIYVNSLTDNQKFV